MSLVSEDLCEAQAPLHFFSMLPIITYRCRYTVVAAEIVFVFSINSDDNNNNNHHHHNHNNHQIKSNLIVSVACIARLHSLDD